MDKHEIVQVLKSDLSEGTEKFRDDLLDRCLPEVACGDDGALLDDEDLEMLAAAGIPEGSVTPE